MADNGPTVIKYETMVLPTGMDPVDDVYEAHSWALFVRYQYQLGWVVTTAFPDTRLSVKGRKWQRYVTPRNRRFYYFQDWQEALDAALEEVDKRTVMNRTWKEHVKWMETR